MTEEINRSDHRGLYAKLVNAGDVDTPVRIVVSGARWPAATATATTLAAAADATNSIDAAQNVVPKTSTVNGVKSGFSCIVPAHGIVVLELSSR
jgi:alpha-L-arabinofuranosidase